MRILWHLKSLIMKEKASRRWLDVFVLAGLALLIIIIFSQKTELSASDLGRHLENGRLFFSHPEILTDNFYSYTEPSQPFINHHWLAGFIFYGLQQAGGFQLLTIFNIFLALAVFFIFFRLAAQRSSFIVAAWLSLPAIFLMSERTEVRPEMFSYLFLGITWLILENKNWKTKKQLIFLTPLFFIWANIHIYFFLGLALVGFYAAGDFIEEFFKRKGVCWLAVRQLLSGKDLFLTGWRIDLRRAWGASKPAFFRFLLLTAAAIINPNHLRGLFYPLNIFRNYGYEIVENKSVFFLSSLTLNYNFSIFKLLLALLIFSLLASQLFFRKVYWRDWFFVILVVFLGLLASRNLAIFGLTALVLASAYAYPPLQFLKERIRLKFLLDKHSQKWSGFIARGGVLLASLLLAIFLIVDLQSQQLFLKGERGLGLSAGSLDVFQFFQEANLVGPIFNNYDAGSALIFGLPDEEKIFVDNRPEAYSFDFFKKIYLPLHEDPLKWQEALEKYGFKTIIVSHADATPWSKNFLTTRLQDQAWALVYFDRYYVVFVDKGAYSKEFLEKYSFNDQKFRQDFRLLAGASSLKAKFNLADLAQVARKPELAEEIYRQVLINKPSNVRALLSLAYLYASSPDSAAVQKAINYFERVIKQEKRIPGVYNQLGLIYWRLADYDRAEKYWLRSKKIGGQGQAAKDYLEQVEDLKERGLLSR